MARAAWRSATSSRLWALPPCSLAAFRCFWIWSTSPTVIQSPASTQDSADRPYSRQPAWAVRWALLKPGRWRPQLGQAGGAGSAGGDELPHLGLGECHPCLGPGALFQPLAQGGQPLDPGELGGGGRRLGSGRRCHGGAGRGSGGPVTLPPAGGGQQQQGRRDQHGRASEQNHGFTFPSADSTSSPRRSRRLEGGQVGGSMT